MAGYQHEDFCMIMHGQFPSKTWDFEQQQHHPLLMLKNLTAHTIIRDQTFGNHLAENGDNFTSLMKK